jgi:hypothetical protein
MFKNKEGVASLSVIYSTGSDGSALGQNSASAAKATSSISAVEQSSQVMVTSIPHDKVAVRVVAEAVTIDANAITTDKRIFFIFF